MTIFSKEEQSVEHFQFLVSEFYDFIFSISNFIPTFKLKRIEISFQNM